MIELLALDIAGTTVDEGGTVYQVLADTVRAAGGDPAPSAITRWMGAGKREAITALLRDDGLDPSATAIDTAFADFRERLGAAYRSNPPALFPGMAAMVAAVRDTGTKVALTTGFDREVTTNLLEAVGWAAADLDAVICIDDVTFGRPAPYLIFRAMERTGVCATAAVLTAGDTVRDVEAGRNAGAGAVVAVTTGEVSANDLQAAGPTRVLTAATEIPVLLAELGQPAARDALQ